MLEEFELTDIYHPHGFVTHTESLKIQNSFDAFLTTSEKVEGGEHYCLPSKIFDYVQKQKPILGFVTEGVQKQFLSESGLGIVCDPDDVQGSAQQIIELVSGKINISPDWNYLEQFHRKNAASKLAKVFKSIVQPAEK
jgi:hypothetical protein